MNADTCAVLAGFFPLALLTIVLESRSVHFNLRRRPFLRNASIAGMSSSLIGLIFAVIGVSIRGYDFGPSVVLWLLFGLSVAGLGLIAMGIMASAENELDKKIRKKARDA